MDFGHDDPGRPGAILGSRGVGGLGLQISWRAVSHCGSSYNTAGIGYFRVIAERGWFALEPAFNYDGIRGMRSDGKAIDRPATDQFAVEMDDFARCIMDGKATRVPGEEGLRDVRLMMAIYESARSGRPIDL